LLWVVRSRRYWQAGRGRPTAGAAWPARAAARGRGWRPAGAG